MEDGINQKTPVSSDSPISRSQDDSLDATRTKTTTTDPIDSEHEDVGNAADGFPEKKEHTRSRMAILFILGFFAILFLCFIYAIMVGAPLSDLKDTMVGIIGALSGILGFIVGYYYKTSQEQ